MANNTFEKLMNNYDDHFLELYGKKYPNQTIKSCIAFYETCIKEKPEKIIEIGTNYGASTISMALGAIDIGMPLSEITTIDLSHEHWKKRTPVVQKDLLEILGLDISLINTVTTDFNQVNPKDFIPVGKKTLIFYDMHDHKGPWSLKLFNEWYPLVSEGAFIIHDITPVHKSFVLVDDPISPRSKATYFNGQDYAGFMECQRLIEWANEHKIILTDFPGGVLFRNPNK